MADLTPKRLLRVFSRSQLIYLTTAYPGSSQPLFRSFNNLSSNESNNSCPGLDTSRTGPKNLALLCDHGKLAIHAVDAHGKNSEDQHYKHSDLQARMDCLGERWTQVEEDDKLGIGSNALSKVPISRHCFDPSRFYVLLNSFRSHMDVHLHI